MPEIRRTLIIDALYRADMDPDSIRWKYSGRDLFEKHCFGFTGNLNTFGRFLIQITASDVPTGGAGMARQLADRVLTDSLGWETIYYFPGMTVTKD